MKLLRVTLLWKLIIMLYKVVLTFESRWMKLLKCDYSNENYLSSFPGKSLFIISLVAGTDWLSLISKFSVKLLAVNVFLFFINVENKRD